MGKKDDEVEKATEKMGNSAILRQTERQQTKNTPCQGNTITSKMAAARGVLCGTNLETHRSRSAVGDTQTHFSTLTVFLKHNEENEI